MASPLSRRILGSAVARSGVSFYDAELLCAASVRAFLHNASINDPAFNDTVALSTPSRASFNEYIDETAAEKLAYLRDSVVGKKIYLSCDKGNKKGIGHFVKIVSYWDDDTKKVRKYLLDCEASGGTSKNCADAINFSLSRLDADGFHVLLSGQCTDAGGGGVGQSLFTELKQVNRILDPNNYLLPTCSLCALQLVLSNPIIKCIGTTGLGIQTAPQLLHSLYNLCTGGGGRLKSVSFN